MFDEIAVRDGLLVIRRNDDPEREQTVVPCARVDKIIRYFYEGPGGAFQARKATSAKIIPRFWCPELKGDVRIYVACCPVCENFLRLPRSPRAGLWSMDICTRGDCLAIDIVGGMESFQQTPRGNRYILTLIDSFTRYALAVLLTD